MVFNYFITDENGDITNENGDALLIFETNNSYHVLWKTPDSDGSGVGENSWSTSDGPIKSVTFNPDPSSEAYDTDYGSSTVSVFGEWERLPVDGINLLPGTYDVQFLLTEESFHGSGIDTYDGGWAAAMAGSTEFTIVPVPGAFLLGMLGLSVAGWKLRKGAI